MIKDAKALYELASLINRDTGMSKGIKKLMKKKKKKGKKLSPEQKVLFQKQPNPISMTYVVPRSKPKVRQRKSGTETFVHKEIVQDINGSVGFSANKFNFNPGLARFAWLSKVAQRWSKYRVKRLRFYFVPSKAVTTTPGTVYLAANHDPNSGAPLTENALSSYDDNNSSPVYKTCVLDVKTSVSFSGIQFKKIRDSPIGQDLQLYDTCSLIYCTVDCADTSAIGKLWVEYEIDMVSSIIEDDTPSAHNISRFGITNQAFAASGVAQDVIWDTEVNNPVTMGLTHDAGAITVPKGAYMVFATIQSSTNTSQDFYGHMGLSIDGVATTNRGFFRDNLARLNRDYPMSLVSYIELPEESEVTIWAELTFGTGTATLKTQSSLIFQAVG
jgi:hypothetical protein